MSTHYMPTHFMSTLHETHTRIYINIYLYTHTLSRRNAE